MNYSVKCVQPETVKTDCVTVGVFENNKLSPAAAALNEKSQGYIAQILKKGDLNTKAGHSLMLYDVPGVAAQRVLLVGCGKINRTTLASFQNIHTAVAKRLSGSGVLNMVSYLGETDVQELSLTQSLRQAAIALESAFYRFDIYKKTGQKKPAKVIKITFAQTAAKALKDHQKAIQQGNAIGQGINNAKTLGNLPGNVCTPTYLSKEAKSLQQKYSGLKTTILSEAEMKKLGMGALLAVSQGSREPAKLIIMEYMQGPKNKKPVVIVGKGITFDTGGISIKPSPSMDEMKFDMCGAASVFGTMTACAELELPVNLVGIVASAENMPGSSAIKPGDIVSSMSGKTIEILNTDAEGRLVLCDALTYAERYNPAAVVDIATLTGACIVALGRHASGLLGNNAKLIDDLTHAGQSCGDRVWELPLWNEYKKSLESNFADIANIGNRDAGTITAASFLSYFAEKYSWAHLDIAGTAWKSGKEKGATGRPVNLLMQYILDKHVSKSK